MTQRKKLNMRKRLIFLFGLTAAGCAAGQPVIPAAAEQTLVAYSNATMNADCDAIEKLSSVLKRRPNYKKQLCDIASTWKSQGLVERLRAPTTSLASGNYRLVVVPVSRVVVPDDEHPSITDGVYVVTSSDSGRNWRVLDVGCEQLPKWVKSLYPPYDGYPKFEIDTIDRLHAQ